MKFNMLKNAAYLFLSFVVGTAALSVLFVGEVRPDPSSLKASVLSAFSKNENVYAIAPSKIVPGTFTFNYQFAKTKSKKRQKNFDLPIVPFNEKLAQKFIPAGVGFGPHRDAWGYPVRENAYQKIALGKNPKQQAGLFETKKAYAFDASATVVGLVNCRANTGVTGYFEAYFEDVAADTNVGYDDPNKGQVRRDTACQVLQDIATLIKLDQTNVTPDILFTAYQATPPGALAAASAYYGYYTSGPDNGSLHKHIISREDPTPGLGNFDAYVITDFTPGIWDIDSTLNAGTYSFYTVIYHEIMHALGFRSIFQTPNVLDTNVEYPHGTFDFFFYQENPPTVQNRFFNEITEFLQLPIGVSSPLLQSNAVIYQGKKNIPGIAPDGIRPIFSPNPWQDGSSLSHFDMNRSGGKVYVMNASIGPNTIRVVHDDEKEVLCHQGYQVGGVTNCELATPSANDDFVELTGTVTPICLDVLSNDHSFTGGTLSIESFQPIHIENGDTLTYFTAVGCSGSATQSPHGARSIRFTPTTSPTQRFLTYTNIDSVSNRVSFPTTVSLFSCGSNPNEYLCNGGFELGYVADQVSSQISTTPGCWVPLPYVCVLRESPDVYLRAFNFQNSWLGIGPTNTHDSSPNDRYAAGNGSRPQISPGTVNGGFETIALKTKTPLLPGTYHLTWYNIHQTSQELGDASMNVTIASNLPSVVPLSLYTPTSTDIALHVPLNSQNTLDYTGIYSGGPINDPQYWQQYSVDFQVPNNGVNYRYVFFDPQDIAQNVVHPLNYFYARNFMDDVSLTQISEPSGDNTIQGIVYQDQNQNGSLSAGETRLGNVTINLYAGSNITPIQTTTTQLNSHLGEYSFPHLSNGVYRVALANENSYQVTEPDTNNPVLISSLMHVYEKTVHGVQVSDGNNFGLIADMCSNLSGTQMAIPSGYQQVGTQCDACPNIDSVQSAVPSGYTNVNGQCIQNTTGTVSTTDVCPNIAGVQTAIPAGYILVLGKCMPEPIKVDTTKTTTIKTTTTTKAPTLNVLTR